MVHPLLWWCTGVCGQATGDNNSTCFCVCVIINNHHVLRILKGIDERIQSAEQEREEKKNFSIEGLDAAPASMKVVDQPVGGLTLGENGEVGPH